MANYSFLFEGTRYPFGVRPMQMPELEFLGSEQATMHLGPAKTVLVPLVHKKTFRKIYVVLINRGKMPCKLKEAAIAGVSVSFDETDTDPNFELILGENQSLGKRSTIGDARALLGASSRTVKAHDEIETEINVREQEEIEYTEEEYDYDYIVYEEKVVYEDVYETHDVVRVDEQVLWHPEGATVAISHQGVLTKILFYIEDATARKFQRKKEWEEMRGTEKAGNVFLKLRSVCCFASLLTVPAFLGLLFHQRLSSFLLALTLICLFSGWLSALFACPVKLLKVAGQVIGYAFALGITIFTVGCVVTTPIGIALAAAMVLFFPAIVTIPYYFKTLRPKLNQ